MRHRVILVITLLVGLSALGVSAGEAAKDQGAPVSAGIQDHSTVEFEYTLTVDGAVVDSSQGRAPMKYVHGTGQIVPGLERQMAGLHVGDAREITVTPEDGYGLENPKALVEVPRSKLPQDSPPKVGMMLSGRDGQGHPFQAKIAQINEQTVTLNMNHPLAGKTLNFKIKVLSITPPAPAAKP